MKKCLFLMGLVGVMGMIVLPAAHAACGGSHAIQSQLSCLIGGLNEPTNGTLDASVRAKIYGVGTGIATGTVCDITSGSDNCTTPVQHIALNGYCGAGSAWLNGNWFSASGTGCESFAEDGTYPAVTALVMEQLSGTGVPQYLAVSVDEGVNGSGSSYFFDPGVSTAATFAALPATTPGTPLYNGATSDFPVTWSPSSYTNRSTSIQTNTPNSKCGSGGTAVTCEHLIYGYQLAYAITDYSGGSCLAPTDMNLTTGGWTVDPTIQYGGDPTCSATAGTCSATLAGVSTAGCNSATGVGCCITVGVVNTYNFGDNNIAGAGAPTTTGTGWYSGGGTATTIMLGGILGPEITGLNSRLVQTGKFGIGVNVGWRSVTENGVVGYNVYRSCSANGAWSKINSAPIPTTGTPGSLYNYTDNAPNCNKTRRAYYKIQILHSGGNPLFYDQVTSVSLGTSPPIIRGPRGVGRSTRHRGRH